MMYQYSGRRVRCSGISADPNSRTEANVKTRTSRGLIVQCLLVATVICLCGCDKDVESEEVALEVKASIDAGDDLGEVKAEESKGVSPAKLVVVHAALGIEEAAILLDGVPVAGAERVTQFEGESIHLEVPSGSHLIAVAPPKKEDSVRPPPLVTKSVELIGAETYLLLIAGVYGKRGPKEQPLDVFLLPTSQKGAVDEQKVPMRAVHGVVNAPPVDVMSGLSKGSSMMLVNVGFGKSSAFHPVDAGPALLEFRSGVEPEAPPIYTSKRFVLSEGIQTTLLWLGKVGSTSDPMRLWALSSNAEIAREL